VRHALRYALAIAWVIVIGAGCFTAGLLIHLSKQGQAGNG
jgi:uncharacterized membrane protein YedE/YeeE